jgi:uncharacterized membrane protein
MPPHYGVSASDVSRGEFMLILRPENLTLRSTLPTLRTVIGTGTSLALGVLLALYSCTRALEVYDVYQRTRDVAPEFGSQFTLVALHILLVLGFALLHGAQHYQVRGIFVFCGICILVGNLIENLGVATGFPFGRYYYGDVMGPRFFHVPVLLGLAYVGMSYLSWTLARLILGRPEAPLQGMRIFTLPLLASFIMTAWDLAQDPVWSTVLHCWVWIDGGPWFGVPISNYLGWLFSLFVIYLLFALYLRRAQAPAIAGNRNWWRLALLFYAACAAGNLLQTIPNMAQVAVQDATGKPWLLTDITGASAIVSIFVMGAFVVLAWARLAKQTINARD